jgi:signal transduction histidine kinase
MEETEISNPDLRTILEGNPFLVQILQNLTQVVWVIDPVTDQILYVSPAFESIWAQPGEIFYDDPLALIKSVHPEDRVKVLSASPDKYHKSTDLTYRILRPNGSLRWISAHLFLVFDETSDTNLQVCIAQDISGQNLVDQTLQKALDRSREQFTLSRRMSLARKPEAVLKTLMSTSELRSANRALVLFVEPLLGKSPRELEVIASWSPSPSPNNPKSYDLINDASLVEDLASSELINPTKPVIVTEIDKDQRLSTPVRNLLLEAEIQTAAVFPLVASGIWSGCLLVLFSQEKHFDALELRHIKVLVDQASITLYNLHLLEAEAESRHEAERANEIKTEFLAMISHELRTPLTSIKGFTTTLLADDVVWEPEEQRDFIQTIQQETNRLQELIDHLLDLSRIEAGMLPIFLESHSINEILDDALPQLNSLTSGHKLTTYVPDAIPLVNADPKRIAQVLVNLVRNASTYAPKGTEINISAILKGGFVQINVKDEGPGIPPAEHKTVFKAFQRGANIEKGITQGAGLGLAICKGLVEAHGGRIWIKKKSSPGTTISFTIPIVLLHILEGFDQEER